MGNGAYWWVALDNAKHPERYSDPIYQALLAIAFICFIVGCIKLRKSEP
jgi:hypothetical protein